jgi:hypothetical protein
MPMLSKVGSTPIKAVAIPMISSDVTSIALRPILSPKWPKTSPPKGLAAKPTAYVEAEASLPAVSLNSGKKSAGKMSAAAVP